MSGQRPETRPAGQRPGEGGSGTRPGQGEGDRGSIDDKIDENREDRQQHREDMQQDRQVYANNVREDIEEEGGYWGGGGVWVGDWDEMHVVSIDDDDEETNWGAVIAGLAVGTAITAATFSAATTKGDCTPQEITVEEVGYVQCGSTWYSRVMQSGEVRYIVVAPPPGY